MDIPVNTDQSKVILDVQEKTDNIKKMIDDIANKNEQIDEQTNLIEQRIALKKKILIVDDEQYNRMAVGIILDAIGIQNSEDKCDNAINGQDALDKVKKDIEANNGAYCSYDLILMDCNMPVMDGYEATSKIRQYIYE